MDAIMEAKKKFLMIYFNLLVSEGTLEQGTITPVDAEFLVNKLDEIEQKERVMEFAQ